MNTKSPYVINVKKPEDSAETIVKKLNTLRYAIDPSVIKGDFVTRDEFKSITEKNGKMAESYEDRVNYNISQGRKRLTDMRWHGGGGSGGGGGSNGFQRPLTGAVNGSNPTFTFTSAPNVLSIDGVTRQKLQSDGTVNWIGTTNITLTGSPVPVFDFFAIA